MLSSRTVLAVACVLVSLAPAAMANPRQTASPVWGTAEPPALVSPSVEAYQMTGIDFDPATPGLEQMETFTFDCGVQDEGGGMVKIWNVFRLRFRSSVDGSIAYTTYNMIMRSQMFPDPFDLTNQTNGQMNYAYFAGGEDMTVSLQRSIDAAADRTQTLCYDMPRGGPIGANLATTQGPSGTRYTLLLARSLTGGYALKANPSQPTWDGVQPVEGAGVLQYWAIEATPGEAFKGGVVSTRVFSEQGDDNDPTPFWQVRPEWSLVGDIQGTGSDLIRIVETMPDSTPGLLQRRTRHFDARSSAPFGVTIRDTILE